MSASANVVTCYLTGDGDRTSPQVAYHVEYSDFLKAAYIRAQEIMRDGLVIEEFPALPTVVHRARRFVPAHSILHVDVHEFPQEGMKTETTDALFASRPLATVAGMSPSLLLDIPEPPAGILNRMGDSHD